MIKSVIKLSAVIRIITAIPVLIRIDFHFLLRSSLPAEVIMKYAPYININITTGATKYIARPNIVFPTAGIYDTKSPTATNRPQSPTNPTNMRDMIPYTIRFFAFFFFSSSPPESIKVKNHQVNMVTAAPKINTRKNATILPRIPSNPALFQKYHPSIRDQPLPGVSDVPEESRKNMV